MNATVRNDAGAEGLADALARRDEDARGVGISGLRAYHLIRTLERSIVTVSVYDDRAGTEGSVRAAGEWIRTNVLNLASKPSRVTSGKVLFCF